MSANSQPVHGDWMMEQAPGAAPSDGSSELRFRLWRSGMNEVGSEERAFATQQDAGWALQRRAQRDQADAWWVASDLRPQVIGRFRV